MPILLAIMLLRIHLASESGMMGVGSMLQGGGSANAPPPPTFYLTNDAGVRLTNDAGTQRILTQ